jgi:Na+:H+ antiporter, NhaA family
MHMHPLLFIQSSGCAPAAQGAGCPRHAVAGIGFTVALFIAGLAFPGHPDLLDQAKVGILAGSLAAGVGGSILLRLTRRTDQEAPGRRPASTDS